MLSAQGLGGQCTRYFPHVPRMSLFLALASILNVLNIPKGCSSGVQALCGWGIGCETGQQVRTGNGRESFMKRPFRKMMVGSWGT